MPALDCDEKTLSPALTYARLLRESQVLIAAGKGDSSEAEALADRMDRPWYAMTDRELQRMRGLSVDLYALAEEGPKRIEMSPDQLAHWQQALKTAWARYELGDVDAALNILRRPVPASLPGHIVPFLQARCWEKLGDLETAALFTKEGERSRPKESESLPAFLQQLNHGKEAVREVHEEVQG